MAKIYTSVDQLVGHTPLVEFKHLEEIYGLQALLLGKLESRNPAGSAKDRVALSMLNEAEKSGLLQPGGTVIEPTSGNTGIGLAALGVARGYRVIIIMPDTMSKERRTLVKAYGAELVLTPGAQGMAGAVSKAEELHGEIPGSMVAGQFVNPANPAAHRATTGPEIWEDAEGAVDAFVAGIGTGGTITGAGSYLKEKNPALLAVGVEPAASPLLTEGHAGPHKIQGIGANFIPDVLDKAIMDEVLPVTNEDAYALARLVGAKEGILMGISSGAALWAAIQVAKRPDMAGKTVVAFLPDGGDHYLSTDLFD